MTIVLRLLLLCSTLVVLPVSAGHFDPSRQEDQCREKFERAVRSHTAASGDNAVGVCSPLAEKGSHWGRFYLGRMYLEGITVTRDVAKGVLLVGASAQAGLPAAQTRVGRMYLKGEGVPQDHNLAARWFFKAAQAGDGQGQLELGLRFYNGEGVPLNYLEAYRWLSLALRANQEEGHENLMKLSTRKMENAKSKLTPAQVAAIDAWVESWTPPAEKEPDAPGDSKNP